MKLLLAPYEKLSIHRIEDQHRRADDGLILPVALRPHEAAHIGREFGVVQLEHGIVSDALYASGRKEQPVKVQIALDDGHIAIQLDALAVQQLMVAA